MRNEILHPAQPTKTPAELVKRIGTNIVESGANFFYVSNEDNGATPMDTLPIKIDILVNVKEGVIHLVFLL
jgi:hypothetical protein